MNEDVTLNGISLDSMAYLLTDVSGLFTTPPKRGRNATVPGRHGSIRTVNKRYDEAEYILPLWVAGANPDGSIPTGSSEAREFWKRRDELLRVLAAPTVLVQFTRPDGLRVEARCEVAETLDFTRHGDEGLAEVKVVLTNTDAFWTDASPVTQNITGPTGTTQELTEFASASAPMTDLRVTFQGPVSNPQLLHGTKSVQYQGVIPSGRQLVLNTKTWTPSPGTGAAWSPDLRQVSFFPGPPWFELDPSVAPFAVTFNHTGGGSASCSITGPRAYLSP